MLADFPDWYREVDLEPDRDTIALRWRGVEALASQTDLAGLPGLTRAFYRTGQNEEGLRKRLRTPFADADPAFPNHGNDAELAVLAGAALAAIMLSGKKSEIAIGAALLIVAASLDHLRSGAYNRTLIGIARNVLRTSSAELRIPTAPAFSRVTQPKVDATELAANTALIPTELEKVAAFSRSVYVQLVHWNKYVEQRLHLMQEELDITWWLLGGSSFETRLPINSLPAPAAAVTVGAELASLIRMPPGPRAADAILDRMLGAAAQEPVDLEAAVFESAAHDQLEWARLPSDHELTELLPLTSSLSLAREGATREEWLPWAERKFGISLPASLAAASIARQVYCERLALNALGVSPPSSDEA